MINLSLIRFSVFDHQFTNSIIDISTSNKQKALASLHINNIAHRIQEIAAINDIPWNNWDPGPWAVPYYTV